ncbi:hypothetical protein SCUCBS95973_004568 [Sporothrix curviconia]|uniref:Uncharacterized protein n=1 Tax=Sporothrix curviconia TaxID=1260050 RepID=A0ABP0BPV4_9PEZI
MGELSTGREDMEQGENNGDDMICGTGRDASVAAAPRVTMATVVLQRQEKKGRLTMPQMFQRRGARWQRILFKYQTGQLLQDFPSKLCNQVLPKEVQQGEQETVEYVTAEKHASQELLLDETDEPVAHKKQKMDPWQDAVDRDELASGSTAKGFELVEISDAAAVPPVPPSSPMQLDPFEPPQICIEPVEELIQKLHALKLGDDCDGGFVSANAPVDEGCSSRMDIVLAAPPNGPYNAASSDYMQMDHHRHGSGPVSTYSSSSNNSCPPLYSTSMDDVQVDIPHDARLQIELDMTMRDIDYYDADEEQEEGDDSGYSCQFTTRFPTPDTRNYGSHCTFHSMDHIGSDSDDDADDCEMVDLSDALSMLSLVADRPPSPSQDALDRTVQAVGVRKARIRQLGMWWCRCTKTKAGDFVAKARRGLRADKTDKTNRANKTNAANEANLKMPAEKIVKSRARKTPRMPRFPWHFNYWA